MDRRSAAFRPRVTRLRVLRRGWGQFTAEEVTFADVNPAMPGQIEGGSELDLNEILDLDDEEAEMGLAYGRERPN